MNQQNRQLTPLQILSYEKKRLTIRCDEQEQRINQHLSYIHQHAGRFLIAGMNSLFFPSTANIKSREQVTEDNTLNTYLHVLKDLVPTIWEMVRPLLISWGFSKMRNSIKLLLKKI